RDSEQLLAEAGVALALAEEDPSSEVDRAFDEPRFLSGLRLHAQVELVPRKVPLAFVHQRVVVDPPLPEEAVEGLIVGEVFFRYRAYWFVAHVVPPGPCSFTAPTCL